MNLKPLFPVLALALGAPAYSQVQLFEQEMSGLSPYVGIKYNPGIQEYQAGVEYNIDGRTALGFAYAKPLKDTLKFDPSVHAYSLNPYAVFEFIEPGSMSSFSFSLRTDFIYENSFKNDTTFDDIAKLNNFQRSFIGGGPIFGLRIFSSEKLAFIPTVAYELFYIRFHRDNLKNNLRGTFDEDDNLWHDITGALTVHYLFNEFNGISIEPKVVIKVGPGRTPKDLINASLNLGYAWGF